MFRYLSLIVKSGLRNRRRSSLTILSIAVSLCLLGVLMAMYRALFLSDQPSPAQALRMIVHHKVSLTVPLISAYEAKIRQIPGVKAVSAYQWFGGVYKDPKNFFARLAVEPDEFFKLKSELQMPEEQRQAFLHLRTGCIAGVTLAQKYGWKVGDRITIVGDIFPFNAELTLVGVYNDPEDTDTLYMNQEYIRQAMQNTTRADQIGAFWVQADNAAAVPEISKAIDDEFANSPYPTKTESEKAFALSFISFLGNLRLFLAAICGAVTFTILLVSANTISMSVRERVREVGILKTLGFTTGNILSIIVGEAIFIAGAGGALGSLLAAFLVGGVKKMPMTAGFFRDLAFTSDVAAAAMGVALFIGLVSSLLPAWGASRTSILESLKYTG
ncbi:MAG TPA: FtsX-like permease family protein [Bryobacteraceae bacterium]|nr:FtsX-like permease family protein [Bryobacteraceae bacterium]